MADASLHFALGMAAGMALTAAPVKRAWETGNQLAPAVWRSLRAAWGLGIWAIVPSLLHLLGTPPELSQGWWMNLFLFHPLINHVGRHATLIGAFALVAGLAFQYALVLAALLRIRTGRRGP